MDTQHQDVGRQQLVLQYVRTTILNILLRHGRNCGRLRDPVDVEQRRDEGERVEPEAGVRADGNEFKGTGDRFLTELCAALGA